MSRVVKAERFISQVPARFLALCLAMAFVGGCSSLTSPVKTWSGADKSEADTGMLYSPSSIKIKSVNGRQVGDFLLSDLDLKYLLLPGDNRIIFTYETLWSVLPSGVDAESRAELVVSDPVMVNIPVEAGGVYRFELPHPDSRSEAEAMAGDMVGRGSILNAAGKTVAVFEAVVPMSKPEAVQKSVQVESSGMNSSDASGSDRLGEMKTIWEQASQSEKEAFLRWAFQ